MWKVSGWQMVCAPRLYNRTFSQMQIISVRIESVLKIDKPVCTVTLLAYRPKLKMNNSKNLENEQFFFFVVTGRKIFRKIRVIHLNTKVWQIVYTVAKFECYFYRHLFSCLQRLVARQHEIKCYCEFFVDLCGSSCVNKATAGYFWTKETNAHVQYTVFRTILSICTCDFSMIWRQLI